MPRRQNTHAGDPPALLQHRGVTRTSGATPGVCKYDVQFVFCDNGTKKHPKLYGFTSLEAAARAFDVLTCKRALEKGRSPATLLAASNGLGTNLPVADYQQQPLLDLLATTTRDDLVYGLKQCAKKGFVLAPGHLVEELKQGIDQAQREAEERQRLGDPRQSYEAVPASERKRRHPSNVSIPVPQPAAGTARQSSAQLRAAAAQAQATAAAAAAATAAMQQQQQQQVAPRAVTLESTQPMPVSAFAAAAAAVAASQPPQPGGALGLPAVIRSVPSVLAPLGAERPGSSGAMATQGSGEAVPLARDLQQQMVPPAQQPVLVAAQQPGLEGLPFLLELLRLGAMLSTEIAAAHDVVRIWATAKGGKQDWAAVIPSLHLSPLCYQPLVAPICTCLDLASLLALCCQLWQAGMLRALAAAHAGSAQQASLMGLLQQAAGMGPSAAAMAGVGAPGAAALPCGQGVPVLPSGADGGSGLLAAAMQSLALASGITTAGSGIFGTPPAVAAAAPAPGPSSGAAALQQLMQMAGLATAASAPAPLPAAAAAGAAPQQQHGATAREGVAGASAAARAPGGRPPAAAAGAVVKQEHGPKPTLGVEHIMQLLHAGSNGEGSCGTLTMANIKLPNEEETAIEWQQRAGSAHEPHCAASAACVDTDRGGDGGGGSGGPLGRGWAEGSEGGAQMEPASKRQRGGNCATGVKAPHAERSPRAAGGVALARRAASLPAPRSAAAAALTLLAAVPNGTMAAEAP
eukprot:scaffold7.g3669.t1